VVASGEAENFFPWSRARFEQDPEHSIIWNGDGIGSRSSRFFRVLLKGSGSVDLRYQSDKGGTIEQSILLESTGEDES
jgi:hypothetical protein